MLHDDFNYILLNMEHILGELGNFSLVYFFC